MFRLAWGPLLFVMMASPAPATAQPAATEPDQTCTTVDSCLAVLIAQAQSHRQVSEPVRNRLATFGDTAVEGLLPLLMHPDLWVRESAGLSLTYFRRIDPRHLPTLVHAWRHGDVVNAQGRGNGWLPKPIAATGTEEALRLLWQDYLREPVHGSNAQVFFALSDMGDRVRPLLLERFTACRNSATGDECEGIYALLGEFDPPFPPWSVDEIAALASTAVADQVRAAAESELVRLRHPAGLPAFQQRLAAFSADMALGEGRWDASALIRGIAGYGAAGRSSGAAIARYLDPRFDEDLRADAALALGKVEDATATSALLALDPELQDDWLLAYNVAESLGRMRAVEARPLLERLASGHWHLGVRHNAARALNAIETGGFARPGVSGDGTPYPAPRDEDGTEYLYFGHLRFAGDDQPDWCRFSHDERTLSLDQDPIDFIRWPQRGSARLAFSAVDEATSRQIRGRIPIRQVQGDVMAAMSVRGGELVAFNGGEFGGGLYFLPDMGSARPLLEEPVDGAWRMGGRLFVAAGLAHLFLDTGHLYVVDPRRLRVERVIRLPASPRGVFVSTANAVVIRTRAGDLAIAEDGRLLDPESIDGCGDDQAG